MKTATASALIALAAVFSSPALAAGEQHQHGATAPAAQSQAPAGMQMVVGVVKKVDKAAGKVTIAHGPLTNLGMNTPMTMVFRVQDPAWLDRMQAGDRIRFMADKVNGVFSVVHFEAAK